MTCPTCGKRIGKWDQIFFRLKKGEQVRLEPRDAKNVHDLARQRGLRVQLKKYHLILMGRA